MLFFIILIKYLDKILKSKDDNLYINTLVEYEILFYERNCGTWAS